MYESEYKRQKYLPDLAMWIDAVDSALGNPILFNIQSIVRVEDALKIRDEAAKTLLKQRANLIVVVYDRGSEDDILNNEVKTPNIVFITFSRFERTINEKGLGKTIIDLFYRKDD
ncbi:MAG: hypothetical protein ACR2J4_03690 [Deinococcus sp.]